MNQITHESDLRKTREWAPVRRSAWWWAGGTVLVALAVCFGESSIAPRLMFAAAAAFAAGWAVRFMEDRQVVAVHREWDLGFMHRVHESLGVMLTRDEVTELVYGSGEVRGPVNGSDDTLVFYIPFHGVEVRKTAA